MGLRRLIVLPVLFVLANQAAAAGNCQVDPFQLNFGLDGETHMVVKSGTTCGVSFMEGGRGRTVSAGGINALAIGSQPSHGRAETSGLKNWSYQPQKGFVGQDSFVVDVSGEIMYNRIIRGTSHIAVSVDVVP